MLTVSAASFTGVKCTTTWPAARSSSQLTPSRRSSEASSWARRTHCSAGARRTSWLWRLYCWSEGEKQKHSTQHCRLNGVNANIFSACFQRIRWKRPKPTNVWSYCEVFSVFKAPFPQTSCCHKYSLKREMCKCCDWNDSHSSCTTSAQLMAELTCDHMSDLLQSNVTQSTVVHVTSVLKGHDHLQAASCNVIKAEEEQVSIES